MSTKRKSRIAPDSASKKQRDFGPSGSHSNNIEVEEQHPLLQQDYVLDLEQEFDRYCLNWSSKCSENSNYELRDPTKSEVYLDGYGMSIVTSFRKAAQIAIASGRVLDSKFLEMLVLVLRSDSVHAHSHISHAAYAALMWYLEQHPYATLKYSDITSMRLPRVSISPSSVWTPIEHNRDSFTSKYLLVPDISISGRNYKTSKEGKSQNRRSDDKWASPIDMIAHCIEKGALQSAAMDLNGDLLLLHYLLAVIEQDLNVRLTVFKELAQSVPNTASEEEESTEEGLARQRKDVLVHSLAWKIFADSYVNAEQHRHFVYNLVRLIVGDDIDSSGGALNEVEDEPEDDAPASACVFTRKELSALGSRLLNLQMELFGAAEGAGLFLATARNRSSSINHRMALDSHLLNAFWNEKGVCKRPEAARSLIRSMRPRDALRVLGLLTAQKFACTYDATSLGTFGKKVKDLTVLHDVHSMLDRGSDVSSFFEVDIIPVVSSFHREPQRALKTYKTVNHLAVMMGSITCAVHALLSKGSKVQWGDGGMKKFCDEMHESIQAIVGLVKEGKSESASLSPLGYSELLVAQMTLARLKP